ncbi:ribonuclease H [Nitzschia inconspicua]|uniref:Ribonuclease n=1 Tax=Nitzschia inconspicua TaxID=303405 RepID=A0A9K3M448_9STRA|nr:ribonuclease H [Nitzschia inconspicua]
MAPRLASLQQQQQQQQQQPSLRRRSTRLLALQSRTSSSSSKIQETDDTNNRAPKKKKAVKEDPVQEEEPPEKRRRRRQGRPRKSDSDDVPQTNHHRNTESTTQDTNNKIATTIETAISDATITPVNYLPRYYEKYAIQQMHEKYGPERQCFVMGIDEAGRGPLAGPVVIAGVVCPFDIDGVVDSKRITKEEDRDALYETIMDMYHQSRYPQMEWAACIIDAARIDEINILQATMEGMKAVAQTIVGIPPTCKTNKPEGEEIQLPLVTSATIEQEGCYVVCSENVWSKHQGPTRETASSSSSNTRLQRQQQSDTTPLYHALVDGNRLPKFMPCSAETVIKGDAKEFSIAAASIMAKVIRDRLMRGYDELYPVYNLQQHKGYPTAEHMSLVKEHGASKIHRRTFAPLKHMSLDENGRILY